MGGGRRSWFHLHHYHEVVDFTADAWRDCGEHNLLVRLAELCRPHIRAYRERDWARCGAHLRIPMAGQQDGTSAEATVLLFAKLAVVHCAILPIALQRELLPQLVERLGVQFEFRASAAVGWPTAARGVPPSDPLQARVRRQPGSPASYCRQVRKTWRDYSDHSDHRLWSSHCCCQREGRSNGWCKVSANVYHTAFLRSNVNSLC